VHNIQAYLNSFKTEAILVGTPHQVRSSDITSIRFSGISQDISFSTLVTSLGVKMDSVSLRIERKISLLRHQGIHGEDTPLFQGSTHPIDLHTHPPFCLRVSPETSQDKALYNGRSAFLFSCSQCVECSPRSPDTTDYG
ncbi:hypothetical protein XENOCAPTIV_027966, partial [Xenoophorus captivus]